MPESEKKMQKETKSKYFFELTGNSVLAGLFFAFIYYLYFYQPVAFVFFIAEDGWSEYGTFILWIFTFCVLVWALVKYPDFRKPGHFIFAFIAFLIAMEEISWGQRIFQIASPSFFQAHNIQNEITLHNLIEDTLWGPYIGTLLLIGAFILPVIAKLSAKFRYYCNRLGIPIVSIRHWPFFILPIYFMDYEHYFIKLVMNFELGELSLAVAVSVMTLDLVMKMRLGRRAYGWTAVMATIGMIGVVWILTAPLVHFSYFAPHLNLVFDYVGNYAYIKQHRYRQADLLFDYRSRHPEYLGEESPYYHGLVLMKLGHDEEAKQILERALMEQVQRRREDPESPDAYRYIGKILHVLDRTTEAKQAYLQAVALDIDQLSKVCDLNTGAVIRWSLAKTFFAMGRFDVADEQIQEAAEITPLRSMATDILSWIYIEKKLVANLLPSERKSIKADFPPIPGNKYLKEKVANPDPTILKWSFQIASSNIAKPLCLSDDPEAVRIVIEKAKTKNSWDIQLKYPQLKVRSNQVYRVQLRARADSPRSIFVGFARAHKPWTGLGLYQEIALIPEWQSFQKDFTATGDEDNAHIYFDLGGSDISVELSGVILLSPEERMAHMDPRELKWSLGVTEGNAAKLVFPSDNPEALRIAIEKAKTKNSWDIQLKHPRLEVRSNQVYRVQLRARADSPRSMFVGFARAHKPWTGLGLYQEIALTPEWQSFQADFTATGDDDNAHIYFDLGGSDISVEVSGVVLLILPDDQPVESIKPVYPSLVSGEAQGDKARGINDVKVFPEARHSAGIILNDGTMYTPMERQGNFSVSKLKIPPGANRLDYTFKIKKKT